LHDHQVRSVYFYHSCLTAVYNSALTQILCVSSHLDRLDEALIRPGRVDVRARFGKATQSQAKELFIKFFPQSKLATAVQMETSTEFSPLLSDESDAGSTSTDRSPSSSKHGAAVFSAEQTEELASRFAAVIPNKMFSIAQLQGFLMGYKKTPELAVEHANEFVQRAGSAEVSGTAKIGYDEEEKMESTERQYYWEGSEEQEKERKEFREEKERERRASLKSDRQ